MDFDLHTYRQVAGRAMRTRTRRESASLTGILPQGAEGFRAHSEFQSRIAMLRELGRAFILADAALFIYE
jgi:hypothetical protein